MGVFKVLTDLKGVFGKAYLLSGLLPAVLLLLAWRWFRGGQSLSEAMAEIVGAFGEAQGAAAVGVVATCLILGLLLFAARDTATGFVQVLPGRLLAPLRRTLTQRQAALRNHTEREAEHAAHLLMLVPWIRGPRGRPAYVPPEESPDSVVGALNMSARAREAIEGVLRVDPAGLQPIGVWTSKRILRGLGAMYGLAHHQFDEPPCTEELARWGTLVNRPGADRVLSDLAAEVNRWFVEARGRLDRFPDAEWLRPTALGTRLAALDDYADKRYGIDTSTLLSRLVGVLEKDERGALADARLSVEVLVNLSIGSFVILGVVCWDGAQSTVRAWRELSPERLPAPDWRTLAFLIGAALGCVLFYRGAVVATSALADQVMRLVDLRRLTLVEKLGFTRPADVEEERRLWKELQGFFADGVPLDPIRPIRAKGD